MKIKTAELSGIALDWAVAKCDGIAVKVSRTGFLIYSDKSIPTGPQGRVYDPSTHWTQGGPLIERERIQVAPLPDKGWRAHWRGFDKANPREVWMDCFDEGVTALIAAMRCFVASKLGDEVDVPEELLTESEVASESAAPEPDPSLQRQRGG
jgi:hypothetical protein